jgi:hypothetical protein
MRNNNNTCVPCMLDVLDWIERAQEAGEQAQHCSACVLVLLLGKTWRHKHTSMGMAIGTRDASLASACALAFAFDSFGWRMASLQCQSKQHVCQDQDC